MKKLSLLIYVACVIPGILCAQNIPVQLTVEVADAESRDSLGAAFYPYKLYISQDLDVRAIPCDTLHLKLENVGFFQTVRGEGTAFKELIPNMSVYAKKELDGFSPTDFIFDGVHLIIPKRGNGHIRIAYGYYSDLCFRTHVPMLACWLLQYDSDANSWYFTTEKYPMEFQEVRVNVPKSAELFANCGMSDEGNDVVSLDLADRRYKNISLYLADNQWYDRHTFDVNGVKVTLLLSKRDTVKNENELPQPLPELSDEYVAERKAQVAGFIGALNKLFPDAKTKDITVLEDELHTLDEKYAYGKALLITDEKQAVFIDRTFWNTSLVHELVHCFFNYNYERIAARYFFDESLIEYFANYVYYPDPAARDRAFMDKIEYFLRLPDSENCSIFNVQRNHVVTETGEGTMGVIYYKVPFLIHQFAKGLAKKNSYRPFDPSINGSSREKHRNLMISDKSCWTWAFPKRIGSDSAVLCRRGYDQIPPLHPS